MNRFRASALITALAIVPVTPVEHASAQSVDRDAEQVTRARPGQAIDAERPNAASSDTSGRATIWLPTYGFGMYLGGGALGLRRSVRDREGIDSPKAGLLGWTATLWRHLFLDVGFGLSWASDRIPFEETACSVYDPSECNTTSSTVFGLIGWAKLGPQLRILVPLSSDGVDIAIRTSAGVRGISLTRSAHVRSACSNCREDGIGLSGTFVAPELELAYAFGKTDAGAFGARVAYEHYLSGDFAHGLWLTAFFDGYW